jgi:catalase-peroxidase
MPIMTDADMAMKMDPTYNAICQKFMADPDYFADTFARAWFKLTHRDMGPKVRYIGPDVPEEDLIWQDPVPEGPTGYDVAALKAKIAASGLSVADMVATAWDSARTYRGPTCAAAPTARASVWRRRRTGKATSPSVLPRFCRCAGAHRGRSMARVADVIVLAGNVGVEQRRRPPASTSRCPSPRAAAMPPTR